MKLNEFSEFFHFFRSGFKLYHNGYNIGIYRTNCIISGIIWVIEMGMGGTGAGRPFQYIRVNADYSHH